MRLSIWPTTANTRSLADFSPAARRTSNEPELRCRWAIYINRGITGALVARHPFGGFKMSGGGTKAGGRDYLQHFLFPRVVTENLMRRLSALVPQAGGFAPEETNPESVEALRGE